MGGGFTYVIDKFIYDMNTHHYISKVHVRVNALPFFNISMEYVFI